MQFAHLAVTILTDDNQKKQAAIKEWEKLSSVDVSNCPDDFQKVFHRYVDGCRTTLNSNVNPNYVLGGQRLPDLNTLYGIVVDDYGISRYELGLK